MYDAAAVVDASVVGAGGGGLGYAGLPNSVAIEFDTMGDPSLDEPAVAHVAVLSRGVRAFACYALVWKMLTTNAGVAERCIASVPAWGVHQFAHVYGRQCAYRARELHITGACKASQIIVT